MEALKQGILDFNSLGWYLNNDNKFPKSLEKLKKGYNNWLTSYVTMCLSENFFNNYNKIESTKLDKNQENMIDTFATVVFSIIGMKINSPNISIRMDSAALLKEMFESMANSENDTITGLKSILTIIEIFLPLIASINPILGIIMPIATDLLFKAISPYSYTEQEVLENPMLALICPSSFINLIKEKEGVEDVNALIEDVLTPENIKILFYTNLQGFLDIMKMINSTNKAYYNELCNYLGFNPFQ